ncbi:MAG: hypothetical protein WAK60_06720 [Sedimentisphaerales bacterium]
MLRLTDKQKEGLLKLGRTSEVVTLSLDVLNELIELGLVYKRSDGKFDFTEDGEREYDQLNKKD